MPTSIGDVAADVTSDKGSALDVPPPNDTTRGANDKADYLTSRRAILKHWCKYRRSRIVSLSLLIVFCVAVITIVPIMVLQYIDYTKVGKSNGTEEKAPTPAPAVDDDRAISKVQANPFVPPLNEPFPYHEMPIRGINLGGWLVLEPFITPSLFELGKRDTTTDAETRKQMDRVQWNITNEDDLRNEAGKAETEVSVDEWTLCKRLGPARAREVLEQHYDTFVTEADFATIREMGFNHVRIPIGHWAVRPQQYEPYVPHVSWKYLLRGIKWAKKHGLRVMVELHTAVGSQNGWNHSGREGRIRWIVDPIEGKDFATESIEAAKDVIHRLYVNQSNPGENELLIPLMGVLNEPAIMMMPHEPVFQWYQRSHDELRAIAGTKGPILTYHDGFLRPPTWNDFFKTYDRAILESHMYLIFEPNMMNLPHAQQTAIPCNSWRHDLKPTQALVGEFSFATNDCGKYLNGVRTGSRYEGTGKSCRGMNDWMTWTDERTRFLNTFIQKQMHAYESGIGWFFWTYKTENHINPQWDYLLAWKSGWAPKDVNTRIFTCDNATE